MTMNWCRNKKESEALNFIYRIQQPRYLFYMYCYLTKDLCFSTMEL